MIYHWTLSLDAKMIRVFFPYVMHIRLFVNRMIELSSVNFWKNFGKNGRLIVGGETKKSQVHSLLSRTRPMKAKNQRKEIVKKEKKMRACRGTLIRVSICNFFLFLLFFKFLFPFFFFFSLLGNETIRSFARMILILWFFILLSTTIEKSVEIRLYSPYMCWLCYITLSQDIIQKLDWKLTG